MKELSIKKFAKHGERKNRERLYSIWCTMKTRCNNPNAKSYKDYGGRGIKVCSDWDIYLSFKSWAINNGYSEELTLDRVNVNGDYCPSNCKWSTKEEQANNTRANVLIEINGVTLNATQWDIRYGLPKQTVAERYRRGKRGVDLLKPVEQFSVNINGECLTLREISNRYKIPYNTLYNRYKNGIKDEQILNKVGRKKNGSNI